MKVLRITLDDSVELLTLASGAHRRALATMLGGLLLACHPATKPEGRALALPPVESIALRLPLVENDARHLLRTILFQNGYQVAAENQRDGWLRTDLGGMWVDRFRYRQWHIVVSYGREPGGVGTTVSMRAIEESTIYAAGARRSHGSLETTNGFTRVAVVTDVTQGEARLAWLQLERLAISLSDRGAEILTDISGMTGRR